MAKIVRAKKKCCSAAPRCKRCPVVMKRLDRAGLAKRKGNGTYRIKPRTTKKDIKAARAR